MVKDSDYLTKDVAYDMIARYLKIGGSASAFYKKEGVTEAQFYSWRRRYLKDHPVYSDAEDARPVFHPIEVPAPAHNQRIEVPAVAHKQDKAVDRIELEYPNGVILRVDGGVNDARLASLIKLY